MIVIIPGVGPVEIVIEGEKDYVPIIVPPTSDRNERKKTPDRGEIQPDKKAPERQRWIPPEPAPPPEKRMYSIADRVTSLYASTKQYSN